MKEFIAPWILSPGIALLLLMVGLVFLFRHKNRKAWIFLLLALVIGWTTSTRAFGRFISMVLVSQIEGPMVSNPKDIDLIVVLTGGMDYVGDFGWLPTYDSYRRTMVAYELQGRLDSRIPVLISGGHTEGIKYPSEAEVAKNLFDRRNAELTPTLLEEASTDTYESGIQVAAIAQKREAKDIFLVTSEPHMLRALAVYRGRGIDAIPFPVITIPRGPLGLGGYMPSWRGAKLTSHALYEFYGIGVYLLTGKITWANLSYNN